MVARFNNTSQMEKCQSRGAINENTTKTEKKKKKLGVNKQR